MIAEGPNRGPQAASLQRLRDDRSVRDMRTADPAHGCRRPQSRAASFSIEEAPRRQERSRLSRLPAWVMQPSGLRPSPTDAAAEKALDGAHWAPAPHRKPSAWIAEGPNRGPQAASLQRLRDDRSVRELRTAGVAHGLRQPPNAGRELLYRRSPATSGAFATCAPQVLEKC